MSVWSEIKGVIVVHKEEHFSLKKNVEDFFSGEDYYLTVDTEDATCPNHWKINFALNIEKDGYAMHNIIPQWLNTIPGKFDVDTNLRWLKA